MAGRRDRRLATIPGVKEDAAQILEKFLQRKLAAQNRVAVEVKAGYQSGASGDVLDDPQRHYLRSDSYKLASFDSILHDSGDGQSGNEAEFEKDNFRGKTSSLPSSYKTRIDRNVVLDTKNGNHSPSKKAIPHDYFKAPRSGKGGSVSSSDTEVEELCKPVTEGRKKKTLFTRTKERLRQAFKKQSTDVDNFLKEKDSKDKKTKKYTTKGKKKGKSKDSKSKSGNGSSKNREDVLAEVHTHTHTHIHQEVLHPNGRGGQPSIIRTEETTEETDVQMRRPRKHSSVKDSENGFGGVLGRIRRSFSKRRSTKESIPASNSEEPVTSRFGLQSASKRQDFKRTNSEPASEALSCDRTEYSPNKRKTFSGGDKQKVTNIFSELINRQSRLDNELSDMDTVESPTQKSGNTLPVPPHRTSSSSSPTSPRVFVGSGMGDGNRSPLHLSGLRSANASIASQESFDLDYDCDQVDQFVRSSSGNIRQRSKVTEGSHLRLPTNVVPDGKDSPDHPGDGHNAPFDKKSEQEKDEMYDVIARKLATIADNYVESEAETPSGKDELTSLEKQLLDCLRTKGDQINTGMISTGSPALNMMRNATYSAFQSTVQNAIGHETSVKQIAVLFHLTKRAVQIAGAGGALAMQVKENTLRYFEDKFAAWIVGQGGWDSMLEESDSELDNLDKPD